MIFLKKDKYLILITLITLLSSNLFASQKGREIINHFDITSYHVQELGLKDLVFEVRVSNLVDILNKNLAIGKLKDVYYKVYWISPDIYKIEVMGMPKGFKEIKEELKKLIISRMDFVISGRMSRQVRSYSLKTSFKGNNTLIHARDESNSRDITDMHFTFDGKGKLKRFKTIGPTGTSISNFDLDKKSWSKNKWVLTGMSVKTFFGIQVVKTDSSVEYVNISGFGLPSVVKIKTEQSLSNSNNLKEVKDTRIVETSLKFSKYEVNSGKAFKYITRNKIKK